MRIYSFNKYLWLTEFHVLGVGQVELTLTELWGWVLFGLSKRPFSWAPFLFYLFSSFFLFTCGSPQYWSFKVEHFTLTFHTNGGISGIWREKKIFFLASSNHTTQIAVISESSNSKVRLIVCLQGNMPSEANIVAWMRQYAGRRYWLWPQKEIEGGRERNSSFPFPADWPQRGKW